MNAFSSIPYNQAPSLILQILLSSLPCQISYAPLSSSPPGWVNRHQQAQIEYLKEENRNLREHIPRRRLRFTDDQRRRLALKAQALGLRSLKQIVGIVTPDTLLRWYRNLIARKYDGFAKRGPGRPRTKQDIAGLKGPDRPQPDRPGLAVHSAGCLVPR